MSDAKFKENLLKFGGIDANRGNMYLRGNIRMLGNGSYMSQLTVKDMVVTGNAVIPGISFDSLTVAGNVVSTDGNFIGNGALMTGITSTLPTEANIDIYGNVDGTYANVRNVAAISGNIGNVRMAGGNVSASGQVNVRGNVVARGFIGNGALLTDVKISGNQTIDILGNVQGENANVGVIAAIFGNIGNVVMAGGNMSASGQVNVLGNVTADYFIGNGALLTGILTDLPDIANVDIRGNVTGTYAILENIDAAFGNVGDVEMSGGNMSVSGQVNVAGNVVANCFIGNGALLTGVVLTPPAIANADIRGNVIGAYANVHNVVAMYGNVGNVMISGGNVSVSGQVNVLGNVAANCFIGNGTLLTDLTVTGNQFINILGNVRGEYVNVETVIATFGNVGNVRMENDTVFVGGQVDVLGNVVAEYVIGNGALLTGVILPPVAVIDILGNVDGAYANVHNVVAMYGNVGNVVIENGNVNASGQVNVAGNVVANYFIGNGALFTDIDLPPIANFDIRGNVAGIYANVENIVGIFGNIGNVEMSGGNMSVSGQVNILGNGVANYFIGNGSLLANLAVFGNQTIDTLGNVRGEYVNVETVIATFGNVGAVVMENGNVSVAGQVDVLGNVVAGYFIGNGSLLTDVGFPHVVNIDIRGNVIGTYATVRDVAATSGNIGNVVMSGGNVSIGGQVNVFGNVMAEYFFGDGALLSTLEGAFMKVSAQVDVLGNVTAGYIIGNGALLEGIIPADIPPVANVDIRGNVDGTYANVRNVAAISGNVGNVRMAGGNVSVSGQVNVFDNVVGNCFIGNGALLTGMVVNLPMSANIDIRGNVDGTYANVSNLAAAVGNIGNVVMENGDMSASGQVNVLGNVVANCFIGNGALLTGLGGRPVTYLSAAVVEDTYPAVGSATWKNNDINMTVLESRGIEYYSRDGIFVLEGGITYRITAQLTWKNKNKEWYYYKYILINYDTQTQVGTAAEALPTSAPIGNTPGTLFDILFTPRETGRYVLRMTPDVTAPASTYIPAKWGAFLNIVALGSGFASGFPLESNIDITGNILSGNVTVDNIIVNNVGNVGNTRMENGNVHVSGQVDIVGNVTADFFRGNGALLKNVKILGISTVDIKGNVVGAYANVSNVKAIVGNLGNIKMEKSNIDISGHVNVVGNVAARNFIGLGNLLYDVVARGNHAIDIRGNVRSGTYANALNVRATFSNIGNVSIENANIKVPGQVNVVGNISAGYIIGNGALLNNVLVYGLQYIDINGNVNSGVYVTVNVANAVYGNIGNVTFVNKTGVNATFGNIGGVEMSRGNIAVEDMYILANVSLGKNGRFIGDGTFLENVKSSTATLNVDIIESNVIGRYANTTTIEALFGNIANVEMKQGNIVASNAFIGNAEFSNGNVFTYRPFTVLGTIRANLFIGNAVLTGPYIPSPGNVAIHINGNVTGTYANTSRITANVGGNIGNVLLEANTVTAPGGNIGNVLLKADTITAPGGNIGNIRMTGGNCNVSGQVTVIGNVYGKLKGVGHYLVNTNPVSMAYPKTSNTTVMGNMNANTANVFQITATIFGNIGNVRLENGNINVRGQVNVRGNVVANTFLPGVNGIIAANGNVGNVRMSGDNVSASGQVNVLGNVMAGYFVGNGLGLYDIPKDPYITIIPNSQIRIPDPKVTPEDYAIKLDAIRVNNTVDYNTITGVYRLEANIPYRITAQFGMVFEPNSLRNDGYMGIGLFKGPPPYTSSRPISQITFVYNPIQVSAPIFDTVIESETTQDYFFGAYGYTSYVLEKLRPILYNPCTFVNVVSLLGTRVAPLRLDERAVTGGKKGSWNTGSWEFSATTSAPTPAASAERKYSWAVTGTTLNIKGHYRISSATAGATAGSGEYLLQIPGGYTIDDIVSMAPAGTVAGIPVGHLKLRTATSRMDGTVLAYDETRVKFVILSAGGAIPMGSDNLSTLSIHTLYFTIDVPIKPV
jgi:hypothetical protein